MAATPPRASLLVDTEALAERLGYAEAGVTPEDEVITYCNAGVSAAVGLFALRLAGFRRTANFAGSWYEWEADPANPIETG
jgi:thiosulfate/3-mercaptopyruvate sulfurtransferase